MIATLLSAKAGLEVAPLVVIAVVVAYLASEALTAYVDARIDMTPDQPETPPAPDRRRRADVVGAAESLLMRATAIPTARRGSVRSRPTRLQVQGA